MSVLKIKCTQCGGKINEEDHRSHPVLGVTICLVCRQSYLQTGDLSMYRDGVDKDGADNYCRWCFDGGDMTLCADDRCRNGFCENCIGRNLGDAKKNQIRSSDDWYCFMCDQSQLDKIRVPVKKQPDNTVDPKPSAQPTVETPAKQAAVIGNPPGSAVKQVVSDKLSSGTPSKSLPPTEPQSATPSKQMPQAKLQAATKTPSAVKSPSAAKPPLAAKPAAPQKPQQEAVSKQVLLAKSQPEAPAKQVPSAKSQPEAISKEASLPKSPPEVSANPTEQAHIAHPRTETAAEQVSSGSPQPTNPVDQVPLVEPQMEVVTKNVPSDMTRQETPVKQLAPPGPSSRPAAEEVDKSQPSSQAKKVTPAQHPTETGTGTVPATKPSTTGNSGKKRPYIDLQLFSTSKLFQRPKILKASVETKRSTDTSIPNTTADLPPTTQSKSGPTPTKLDVTTKATTDQSTRATGSAPSVAANIIASSADSSIKTTPATPTVTSGSKSDAIDLAAIQKELDLSDNDSDDFMEASEILYPEVPTPNLNVSGVRISENITKETAKSSSQVKGATSTSTNPTSAVISAPGASTSSVAQDIDILEALEAHASKISEKPQETDAMTKWMMRDANVIRGRLSDLTKSLLMSLHSYDESRFRAEPGQLLSWKNNLITFLEQTPQTLITRCKHLDNFLPKTVDQNNAKK